MAIHCSTEPRKLVFSNAVQLLNPLGMHFTLPPIFNVVRALQPVKTPEPICVQLSALKFNVTRLVHWANALLPTEVTGAGMVMEVMSLQRLKALLSMRVTA